MARVSPVSLVCRSILILLLTGHLGDTAASLSFFYNFSDPATFSHDDLHFEGDAYAADGFVTLTGEQLKSMKAGRVSYKHPVPLWSNDTGMVTGFSASFSFVINGSRRNPLDTGGGLAFFLGPYPSTMPLNSQGGYLGLFNSTTVAAGERIVAVEVDTHGDPGWDPTMSPHVGVDLNTLYSGKNSYKTAADKLVDGIQNVLQVDYIDATKELVITLRDSASGDTPSIILKASVDLRQFLPSDVAIGISAGTGDSDERAVHRVLWWSFKTSTNHSNKLPSLDSAPDASKDPPTGAALRNKSMLIKIIVFVVLCLVTTAVVALLYLLSRSTINGRHYQDRAGSRSLQAALLATCGPRSWISDV